MLKLLPPPPLQLLVRRKLIVLLDVDPQLTFLRILQHNLWIEQW